MELYPSDMDGGKTTSHPAPSAHRAGGAGRGEGRMATAIYIGLISIAAELSKKELSERHQNFLAGLFFVFVIYDVAALIIGK